MFNEIRYLLRLSHNYIGILHINFIYVNKHIETVSIKLISHGPRIQE